jgi:hypothetical protein
MKANVRTACPICLSVVTAPLYFPPKSPSAPEVFIEPNRNITSSRELASPQPHNIDVYGHGMARYRLQFLACAMHVRVHSWNHLHYSALSEHFRVITLAGVIGCLPFLSTPDRRNVLYCTVASPGIPLVVTIRITGSG